MKAVNWWNTLIFTYMITLMEWHKHLHEWQESGRDDTRHSQGHFVITSAHWNLAVRPLALWKRKTFKRHISYSGNKVMDNIRTWFLCQTKNFYENGIHRLVKHWNKWSCSIEEHVWNKLCHLILQVLFHFHLINFKNNCRYLCIKHRNYLLVKSEQEV